MIDSSPEGRQDDAKDDFQPPQESVDRRKLERTLVAENNSSSPQRSSQ
ncbi:MAG: hypothetical protein Q7T61_09810 [Caulobacter sp.]|nr:hypothetical protein [Caulobacter sp.]